MAGRGAGPGAVGDNAGMPQLSATVTVAAPAARVWALVTDWSRQGEWIPATEVHLTRGTGTALGDRVVARTAVGPLGFDDPMEITGWDPPHRCEVRHLGRVVRGSGTFEVEPVDAATARFRWVEQVDVPLGAAGALAFRLLRPVFEALLRAGMRRVAGSAATRW